MGITVIRLIMIVTESRTDQNLCGVLILTMARSIVCDEDGCKYEKASSLKQQDIGETSS